MLTRLLSIEVRDDRVANGIEYTTEVQTWERVYWFIKLDPYMTSWGSYKRGSICATAYDTEAQARAAIRDTAITWDHNPAHCSVFNRTDTETVIKKHRKKVRA